jgi:hypothetical protein
MQKAYLLSVKRIWNFAKHNALCDLIRYKGSWFSTFRESDAHVYGKNGRIRVLQSKDGDYWNSVALIEEAGIDLRDPKLSITSEGILMLLMGGSQYQQERYITRQTRVAFSMNGKHWGPLIPILKEKDWLWRVTWREGIAYGASYCAVDESKPHEEWMIKLFSSSNGIDYNEITTWKIPGKPNETTVRFQEDGKMVALVRREERFANHTWIGTSSYPYHDWNWKETKYHLGGPNFIILPDGRFMASGRLVETNPYGLFGKTAVAEMTLEDLQPILILPSGGIDTSYPGMVYEEKILWLNYYSSHEENTAIYLAKIIL